MNRIEHAKSLCKRGFYNIYQWYCQKNNIVPYTKNLIFSVLYDKKDMPELIEMLIKIFDGKDFSPGIVKSTGYLSTPKSTFHAFKNRIENITKKKPYNTGNYFVYCYLTPKEQRFNRDVFYRATHGLLYSEKILHFLENEL